MVVGCVLGACDWGALLFTACDEKFSGKVKYLSGLWFDCEGR